MGPKNMKKRKVSNVIKQSFRKLKYLDKTQLNYFIVMSFLLGFCLFTGVTYSYFTFSKHLNAATITIAKLKYNLSSPTSGYTSGNVTVPAGEKIAVDLNLASLNKINTKYALKYSTADSGIKVYYSESYKNNMTGEIGPQGSNITMRVIIVNEGTTSGSVNLTISGGYLQNTLETNITEGYFEEDIVIRTVLLEDSLTNGIIGDSFPPPDGEYAYFKTECSGDATPTWNNAMWELELGEISGRVACDVYFKKMSNDIEVYFALEKNDGTTEYTTSIPDSAMVTFGKTTCNTDATATWDTENRKMNITGIQKKTICIGYYMIRDTDISPEM